MFGIQEVLALLFVFALVFSSKIPQIGRKLGESLLLIKKGAKETKEELDALEHKSKPSKKEQKQDS